MSSKQGSKGSSTKRVGRGAKRGVSSGAGSAA